MTFDSFLSSSPSQRVFPQMPVARASCLQLVKGRRIFLEPNTSHEVRP
jgi:hypothetical protein